MSCQCEVNKEIVVNDRINCINKTTVVLLVTKLLRPHQLFIINYYQQ